MDQLKSITDDLFADVFVNNITVIFQYAENDISSVLNEKHFDIVSSIRNTLCNKVKVSFPDYSSRLPINRKAKHLAVQDIIYLSNSILRDCAVRDMDKVFVAKFQEDETDFMMPEFDANDPALVAAQMRSLAAEIKRLHSCVKELMQHKCSCKEPTTGDIAKTLIGAGSFVSDNKSKTNFNPAKRIETKVDESHQPITSELTSSTSTDDETDSFHLMTSRRITRKKQRKVGPGNALNVAPAMACERKELYVGKVNPKCTALDIKLHIQSNGLKLSMKDIYQLHQGDDYSSFRITLPADKFEMISKIWSQGIKIRPYTQNTGPNKKVQHNRGKKTRSPRTKVLPAVRKDDKNSHSYTSGYHQALQDARQGFWSQNRNDPSSTSTTICYDRSTCHPNAWWNNSHLQQHSSMPYFRVPGDEAEWPSLPRPRGSLPFNNSHTCHMPVR